MSRSKRMYYSMNMCVPLSTSGAEKWHASNLSRLKCTLKTSLENILRVFCWLPFLPYSSGRKMPQGEGISYILTCKTRISVLIFLAAAARHARALISCTSCFGEQCGHTYARHLDLGSRVYWNPSYGAQFRIGRINLGWSLESEGTSSSSRLQFSVMVCSKGRNVLDRVNKYMSDFYPVTVLIIRSFLVKFLFVFLTSYICTYILFQKVIFNMHMRSISKQNVFHLKNGITLNKNSATFRTPS